MIVSFTVLLVFLRISETVHDLNNDITDTVNDVCNVLHEADRCYVTKWVTVTSTLTGQSPVQTVPACPIQIRAHHHIDVYTDINQVSAALKCWWPNR